MGQPLRDLLRRADATRSGSTTSTGTCSRCRSSKAPGRWPGRPTRTGWRSPPTRASSSSPPGRPTRWSGSRSSPTTSTGEAPSSPDGLADAEDARGWLGPTGASGRLVVTIPEENGCTLHALQIPDLTWAEQPSGVRQPLPLHARAERRDLPRERSSASREETRVAVCRTSVDVLEDGERLRRLPECLRPRLDARRNADLHPRRRALPGRTRAQSDLASSPARSSASSWVDHRLSRRSRG